MWHSRIMHFIFLIFISSLLSCGAESNVLGVITPFEHRETFDFILIEARVAYDRGDLYRALALSETAFLIAPDSERAALLYGFINLSLAGGDPFSIAKVLAADAEEKKRQLGSNSPISDTDPAAMRSSDALQPLRQVIRLRDEEVSAIGLLDTTDVELPIYLPKCVEEARATLDKLKYIDSAIFAACRFVDLDVRVEGDYRQQCSQFSGPRFQTNRAHFLWAFAHLTEAVTFQSILLYGSTEEKVGTSNLEKRFDKIKSSSISGPEGIQSLLSTLQSFQQTLSIVMPTTGRCSERAPTTQLRATLNDLMAVEAALRRLKGLSPDLGKSLKSALGRFREIQNSGDAGSIKTEQTKLLRQDLTKNIAKSLSEKIELLTTQNGGVLPEDQKTSVCEAFSNIASGAPPPQACVPAQTPR